MMTFSWKLKSAPLSLLFGVCLILGLSSCNDDLDVDPSIIGSDQTRSKAVVGETDGGIKAGELTLVDLAVDTGLTELVAAVTYLDTTLNEGLIDLLTDSLRSYTIFAPTNEAFEAFYAREGVASVAELSPKVVYEVLYYHIARGRLSSDFLVPPKHFNNVPTLLRAWLRVDSEANIIGNGSQAMFVEPDISASNGLIHIIDEVLIP